VKWLLPDPKILMIDKLTRGSVILTIIFLLFLKHSDLGRSMRATSQDRYAASLMGIPIKQTDLLTFYLGTVMTGFTGCLLITMFATNPTAGSTYNLLVWVIVVLGGLGQIDGTLGDMAFSILGGTYQGLYLLFYGGVMIFMVLTASLGIVGGVKTLWLKSNKKRRLNNVC